MEPTLIQEAGLLTALEKLGEVTNRQSVSLVIAAEDIAGSTISSRYEDEENEVILKISDPYYAKLLGFIAGMIDIMKDQYSISVTQRLGRIIVQIRGENLGYLIGKGGSTLRQIQFLSNIVAYKASGESASQPPLIDIEGYRDRKAEELKLYASKIAGMVMDSGRPYKLRPLNAFERRIIHTELQNHPDVVTESEGIEPDRYVVVRPR